jgi:DNA-binding transcriptional MocR family regulator
MPASVDSIFVTHGAQHGISTAIGLLARPGDVILTENLTYSGILALADRNGYQLRGVMMDHHGLIPSELDRSLRETRASVLYCMPSLHTPTGVVMPEQRRDQIVEVIRQHDAFVVEDDAYGFLCNPAVLPLSARLPERSFYIQSFAKSLAPGLRMGAMLVPTMFRDRCVRSIRSTSWMATPIMAEVVSRLIDDGQLETQIRKKRETAARRYALAQSILGSSISPSATPAFHVWLQLPIGRSAAALVAQAAVAGITIAAPEGVQSYDPPSNGIRLCLGAPQSDSDVEFALRTIRQILDAVEPMSLV